MIFGCSDLSSCTQRNSDETVWSILMDMFIVYINKICIRVCCLVKVIYCLQVSNANEKDQLELLEILDCFFDPEKKPVQPKPRVYSDRPRKPRFNKKDRGENINSNNEAAPDGENPEENAIAVVPTTENETAEPIAAH